MTTLHFTCLPMFSSLTIRSSLHSSDVDAVKPLDLPVMTIKDVGEIVPIKTLAQQQLPSSSITLASLPASLITQASSTLQQHLSTANYFSTLRSFFNKLQNATIEEELFREFIERVLQGGVGGESDATSSSSSSAEAAPTQQLLPLSFSSETQVTLQSAFIWLTHLLFSYEGFRSLDVTKLEEKQQAEPATRIALSFLPPNHTTFTSTQSVWTLHYRHLSLVEALPFHVITVKIVSMMDQMIVHATFQSDVLAVKKEKERKMQQVEQSPESITSEMEDDEMTEYGESGQKKEKKEAPVVVAPTVYTIRLRLSEYIRTSLASSSASSRIYRRLSSLLSQYRNRVFKQMLGEEYHAINNSSGGRERSMTNNERTSETSKPTWISIMPQEILLAILQSLTSKELLAFGKSSWSFYYLSSHPFLWRHLCERELPSEFEKKSKEPVGVDPLRVLPASASASASAAVTPPTSSATGTEAPATPSTSASTTATTATVALATTTTSSIAPPLVKCDWKNEYLARRQLKQEAQSAATTRAIRLFSRHDPFALFAGYRRPINPLLPFPQSYHPTPFGVHPDAPFFILPGLHSR